jgi:hypothetical protein
MRIVTQVKALYKVRKYQSVKRFVEFSDHCTERRAVTCLEESCKRALQFPLVLQYSLLLTAQETSVKTMRLNLKKELKTILHYFEKCSTLNLGTRNFFGNNKF